MKYFNWDTEKNMLLKNKRDVCFEDVVDAFYNGRVLDDIKHPNPDRYPNQRIMVVNIGSYAYLVPYVEDDEKVFLKTIIPNRKATKKYLRKEER